MSAVKKQKPSLYPQGPGPADRQEGLRLVKIEAERLRDSIQKSIIDNPTASKKAALILSLWVEGRSGGGKSKKK